MCTNHMHCSKVSKWSLEYSCPSPSFGLERPASMPFYGVKASITTSSCFSFLVFFFFSSLGFFALSMYTISRSFLPLL